jgi:signal transduction histidine kinase
MQGAEGHVEPAHKGVGIPGMRSRLKDFGGSLEIHHGGHGTTLIAVVPLPMSKRRLRTPELEPSMSGVLGSGHRS